MPLHYEGSFEVPAPKERVYGFLTDPRQVSGIIPDLEGLEPVDENNFRVKAKVGISFIKGSMSFMFTFLERRPPSYAKLKGRGTGLGSSVDLEMAFTLEDRQGGGTLIRWSADANVGGLIAGVGSRLLDSAAERYIKQVTNGLQEKLRSI